MPLWSVMLYKTDMYLLKYISATIVDFISFHFSFFVLVSDQKTKKTAFIFTFKNFCLALQTENIVNKITQLKWQKNEKQSYRNEIDKYLIENHFLTKIAFEILRYLASGGRAQLLSAHQESRLENCQKRNSISSNFISGM